MYLRQLESVKRLLETMGVLALRELQENYGEVLKNNTYKRRSFPTKKKKKKKQGKGIKLYP